MEKKFNIAVCINKVNAIGKDNDLMYHINDDLLRFKSLTINNVVVMGRKTFESLKCKPLKNRINIVITSDPSKVDQGENLLAVSSIDGAVELCKSKFYDLEWFIIGGSSLYASTMERHLVDTLYLTVVDDDLDGDVYFPKFDKDEWSVKSESDIFYDDRLNVTYHFVTLIQK